jgi:arylsulfatase
VSTAGRRPNIVWIFGDEWRHDATGYAGNPVVQTPHLDALAARGDALHQVYSESPVCQSSRASLLTVSFPRDHGKFQNGPAYGPFPGPEHPNFLHRLQDAGYRTAAIGKMHFFNGPHTEEELQAYGFDDVFEEYDKSVYRFDQIETPYKQHLRTHGLLDDWIPTLVPQQQIIMGLDPDRVVLAEELDVDDTLDAFLGQQAARYVEMHADDTEPFFLWLGFIGPHPPYDAPAPFSGRYDPAAIPLGPTAFDPQPANAWGEYVTYVRDLMSCQRYTDDDWRMMAAYYYGNITLVDAQIGRVVDAIAAAGLADDTWIVFSADHGELMGDHGLIEKAVFYETSVRVPAIVVPPSGPTGRADGLAQGIDLAATILDVAGADLTGFAGRPLSAGPRDVVFSQIADFTMAFDGRHKLVVHRDTLEPQALHDLVADPTERTEVLGDPASAAVVDDLLASLIRPFSDGRLAALRR